MTIDTVSRFEFPAVNRKKFTSAFDGGRISSGGGVMLLTGIEGDLLSPTDLPLWFPIVVTNMEKIAPNILYEAL